MTAQAVVIVNGFDGLATKTNVAAHLDPDLGGPGKLRLDGEGTSDGGATVGDFSCLGMDMDGNGLVTITLDEDGFMTLDAETLTITIAGQSNGSPKINGLPFTGVKIDHKSFF